MSPGNWRSTTVCRPVLVGVKSDQEPNKVIIEQYRALSQLAERNTKESVREPLDVAGQTNLKQLFALIDGCAIQISGDTGSLHIADALHRPLVGLYGSSDPAHAGPLPPASQHPFAP